MKTKRRKKPKTTADQILSRSEIATLMGVSVTRISQYVAEGVLHQNAKGRHERESTYREIIAHLRKSADFGELRRERMAAQNRILNAAADKEEGDMVSLSELESAMASRVLLTRDRLIRIPGQFANRVAYLPDSHAVEAELERELREACEELSKPISEWPEADPAANKGDSIPSHD